MAATIRSSASKLATASMSSKNLIDISSSIQTTSSSSMDWDEDLDDAQNGGQASREDELFDLIVGTLEDLLMDDSFVDFQNKFMEKNCKHFSADDENKFIYMDIFKAYNAKVEAYIEKKLRAEIPEFKMSEFLDLLRSRPEQLEGDVFDMMSSIGDFSSFKDMMVSFKQEQEGTGIDLSGLLAVTNSKSRK
ncbi:ADP-ribosylation factor-like protein 2-binding protein [Podochytrium sp. JEL0797]|nr:ADP-ribosylation factor-like protein 2-binding protein [Podochytrium sp. JEL0797]